MVSLHLYYSNKPYAIRKTDNSEQTRETDKSDQTMETDKNIKRPILLEA